MTRILQKNSTHFAESTVGGECMLAPVTHEVGADYALINLNPAATLIWESIGDHTPETDLQSVLVATYEVHPREAAVDVRHMVDELLAAGAVSLVAESPPKSGA